MKHKFEFQCSLVFLLCVWSIMVVRFKYFWQCYGLSIVNKFRWKQGVSIIRVSSCLGLKTVSSRIEVCLNKQQILKISRIYISIAEHVPAKGHFNYNSQIKINHAFITYLYRSCMLSFFIFIIFIFIFHRPMLVYGTLNNVQSMATIKL